MSSLLERLQVLNDRATRGPWETRHRLCSVGMGRNGYARQVIIGKNDITVDHQDHITGDVVSHPLWGGYVRQELANPKPFVAEESADAALIVELRNNLPEILRALAVAASAGSAD